MNLTELIEQWIGEEHHMEGNVRHQCQCGNPIICVDHNNLLKDLKSKIPDLIEQIEKEYEPKK